MTPLTAPSFLLSLLLASPFLYFLVAGARTFEVPEGSDAGVVLGQISFLSGALAILWIGLQENMRLGNAVAGIAIDLLSILLYEWTRWTVEGRGFSIALAGEVPHALCESGPYKFVRHPFYLSYLLAFLAMWVAAADLLTAAVFICNLALFVYAARDDERTLANSPLAGAYGKYKAQVGMLLILPRRR